MIATLIVGVVAGVLSGLLGVGGGALFVPALVLILGLSQVDAQATSLLAIVPVALVGSWRQHRYGNLRLREGLAIGGFAIPGALVGVVIVNLAPERAVELAFAALLVWIAWSLGWSALREIRSGPGGQPPAPGPRLDVPG